MDYPVELLLTRAECLLVLADTEADIERTEFRVAATQRSTALQTSDATKDAAAITSLTDQIEPLETRIPTMTAGDARLREEVKLRKLKRDLEALQDEQLTGQGSRAVFRRGRELDAAQRQLAGYEDCKTKVQARHDSLPA